MYIHKAILEKLRFGKRANKILIRNNSEIHKKFFYPENLVERYKKSTPIKNFKEIKPTLRQYHEKKKITCFINYFFCFKNS